MEDELKIYSDILQLPGLKIVDTSFLSSYKGIQFRHFKYSSKKRKAEMLEDLLDFVDFLPKVVNEEVTFPEETISEFNGLEKSLEIHHQTHQETGAEPSGIEEQLNILLEKRKKISTSLLSSHPTETHLSEKGRRNLEELEFLSLGISKIKGVTKRHRESRPLPENKKNDARIFAKAIAASTIEMFF